MTYPSYKNVGTISVRFGQDMQEIFDFSVVITEGNL